MYTFTCSCEQLQIAIYGQAQAQLLGTKVFLYMQLDAPSWYVSFDTIMPASRLYASMKVKSCWHNSQRPTKATVQCTCGVSHWYPCTIFHSTYFSLGLDTDHLTTLTDNLLHWLVQHVRTTIDGTQPGGERSEGGGGGSKEWG